MGELSAFDTRLLLSNKRTQTSCIKFPQECLPFAGDFTVGLPSSVATARPAVFMTDLCTSVVFHSGIPAPICRPQYLHCGLVFFLGGLLIAGMSAGSICFGTISFGGPGSRSVGSSIKGGASIVGV